MDGITELLGTAPTTVVAAEVAEGLPLLLVPVTTTRKV
jgi:hypothetical protein